MARRDLQINHSDKYFLENCIRLSDQRDNMSDTKHKNSPKKSKKPSNRNLFHPPLSPSLFLHLSLTVMMFFLQELVTENEMGNITKNIHLLSINNCRGNFDTSVTSLQFVLIETILQF